MILRFLWNNVDLNIFFLYKTNQNSITKQLEIYDKKKPAHSCKLFIIIIFILNNLKIPFYCTFSRKPP